MHVSVSVRRFALIAGLSVLALAGIAPAAQAGDFKLDGTFVITATKGRHNTGVIAGQTNPGGQFIGTMQIHQLPKGDATGVNVLVYPNGDTLTYEVDVEFDDATGLLVGTYTVTGGTGGLAGATGSGAVVVAPAGDGTGTFALEGTLSY